MAEKMNAENKTAVIVSIVKSKPQVIYTKFLADMGLAVQFKPVRMGKETEPY